MQTLESIFGEVIRGHREKTETSQEAFADEVGVHRTYISAIELGKVSVSIGVAEKLATALGLPLSRIWKDVEKKQAKSSNS